MQRHEWIRSVVLIAVLLALVIVLGQSRRECERPGSSYVPCIEFEKLWRQADSKSVPRARRFPSPWNIEQVPGGYVVKDATGQALAYVYGHEKHTDAKTVKVLSMDEARQIAANIAKLPKLLSRKKLRQPPQ